MKTTWITTSCRRCGARVEGAKHVLLCDGCLDARLVELERLRGRTPKWPGAGSWNGALAIGAVLGAAA
jgi:hypothetical protein